MEDQGQRVQLVSERARYTSSTTTTSTNGIMGLVAELGWLAHHADADAVAARGREAVEVRERGGGKAKRGVEAVEDGGEDCMRKLDVRTEEVAVLVEEAGGGDVVGGGKDVVF